MLICTEVASVQDKERLEPAIDRALAAWSTYAPYLESFRARLRRSRALPPAQVPDDAITMNSRFEVTDERTGKTACYTLVFPEDKGLEPGEILVLSPMGAALFGARVGDEVGWMSSAGPQSATVKRLLYQPESAGHHDQ